MRWLHTYLLARFPFSFHVTIADNGSTDGTSEIAARLEHELDEVSLASARAEGPRRSVADGVELERPTCCATWRSTCPPT